MLNAGAMFTFLETANQHNIIMSILILEFTNRKPSDTHSLIHWLQELVWRQLSTLVKIMKKRIKIKKYHFHQINFF